MAKHCDVCGATATTKYGGSDMCQPHRDAAARVDDAPVQPGQQRAWHTPAEPTVVELPGTDQ
jgi:hypothetical protein